MSVGVYFITNAANGKVYVGSSSNIEKRWLEHKSTLKRGVHKNRYLQKAWFKYGEDCFIFEVVEICSKEFLIDVEQNWLCKAEVGNFKRCYNILPTAASFVGYIATPELRYKRSQNAKNKIQSKESIDKRRIKMLGRKHSDETKAKISAGNKGNICSQSTKEAVSKAHKGKPKSEKFRLAVIQSNKTRWLKKN